MKIPIWPFWPPPNVVGSVEELEYSWWIRVESWEYLVSPCILEICLWGKEDRISSSENLCGILVFLSVKMTENKFRFCRRWMFFSMIILVDII